MSNIHSTKEEPQYCILVNGKETSILSGATKKQAVEFFQKYYPGEQVYLRKGNLFKGFTYKEVTA